LLQRYLTNENYAGIHFIYSFERSKGVKLIGIVDGFSRPFRNAIGNMGLLSGAESELLSQ